MCECEFSVLDFSVKNEEELYPARSVRSVESMDASFTAALARYNPPDSDISYVKVARTPPTKFVPVEKKTEERVCEPEAPKPEVAAKKNIVSSDSTPPLPEPVRLSILERKFLTENVSAAMGISP